MRLKFDNDEKAINFLTKEFKKVGKNPDAFDVSVKEILDLIPSSTISQWGASPVIQAANFYREYELKDNVYMVDDSLTGGGLFIVLQTVVNLSHRETFSIYPKDDKVVVVPLDGKEISEVQKDVFIEWIESEKITDISRTDGTAFEVASTESENTTKDVRQAVSYLVGEFRKRNIVGTEAFMVEVDAIASTIPEDFAKEYSVSNEGKILAVSDYYKQHAEEFNALDVRKTVVQSDSETSLVFSAIRIGSIEKDRRLVVHHDGDNSHIMVLDKARETRFTKPLLIAAVVAATVATTGALTVASAPALTAATAEVGLISGSAVAGAVYVGGNTLAAMGTATVLSLAANVASMSTFDLLMWGVVASIASEKVMDAVMDPESALKNDRYLKIHKVAYDEMVRRNVIQPLPNSMLSSFKYQFLGGKRVQK